MSFSTKLRKESGPSDKSKWVWWRTWKAAVFDRVSLFNWGLFKASERYRGDQRRLTILYTLSRTTCFKRHKPYLPQLTINPRVLMSQLAAPRGWKKCSPANSVVGFCANHRVCRRQLEQSQPWWLVCAKGTWPGWKWWRGKHNTGNCPRHTEAKAPFRWFCFIKKK